MTAVSNRGNRFLWTPEYLRGYLDALWSYAHWKDGTAYVGSTGQTHREAKDWALAQARDDGVTEADAYAEAESGF